ncbi:F-box/FBD/LRR-repeat protein At3g51530-like [Panicum virgatum]|uniref:F-box/FBD/LRR-repeat protein At3g51530-like n=1 Tax=Panicum virgatum TaxID=38727 RepID=UPI0019D603DF|nr:F-box/FBD/LRR-repeat protein At3g51530-like [Panicum virgatum]
MAPLTRRRKKALAAAPPAPAIDPADSLSKLPDEVLAQILSLLPAQEAVRTCVLARTWRDLWKITKRLLIWGQTVEELREFVDGLLRVRLAGLECAPLDACEIILDPVQGYDGATIKELWVDMGGHMDLALYLQMSGSSIVSRHLTSLELRGVWICGEKLDFSGSPALEDLEISDCNLYDVEKISSPSLERLLITTCEFSHDDSGNEEGNSDDSATTKCVLLEGLAQAKDLEMMASRSTFIFRRDLRWCPTFSKLKTLILNENFCEPADRTLPCFLEHTPVLEMLTVRSKYNVEIQGRPDATDESTKILEYLQIVEVKCEKINERVHSFLNFMGTLNICKMMTY